MLNFKTFDCMWPDLNKFVVSIVSKSTSKAALLPPSGNWYLKCSICDLYEAALFLSLRYYKSETININGLDRQFVLFCEPALFELSCWFKRKNAELKRTARQDFNKYNCDKHHWVPYRIKFVQNLGASSSPGCIREGTQCKNDTCQYNFAGSGYPWRHRCSTLFC